MDYDKHFAYAVGKVGLGIAGTLLVLGVIGTQMEGSYSKGKSPYTTMTIQEPTINTGLGALEQECLKEDTNSKQWS